MNYLNVLFLQLINGNIWNVFINYQSQYNKNYSKNEYLEQLMNLVIYLVVNLKTDM